METCYPQHKIDYLIEGFQQGFRLEYDGPRTVRQFSPNLPFSIGDETLLWNHVMKEVQNQRYAGPYREPPFDHFIHSPIGLVPKRWRCQN